MKLIIEVYDALCATKKFSINGIKADTYSFGEGEDRNPEEAEDYACADMQWKRRPNPREGLLDLYGITEEEYHIICDKLEEELSFGDCGWCV